MGELVLLSCTRYDISAELTILKYTLWSAIDPEHLSLISRALNDFKHIVDLNLETYGVLHHKEHTWLSETMEAIRAAEPQHRIMVFTHHAPTLKDVSDSQYYGGSSSSAFATELTERPYWGPPVKLWAFGHTHWSCDFLRNGVRVYSNQRGYKKDGSPIGYDLERVVEL